MWRWISRVMLAIGFLMAVVGLVAKPTALGQSGEKIEIALPLMARNAAVIANPPLHDYIGLVKVEPDFYTIRADSTDWRLVAEDSVSNSAWAWSPDGHYLLYTKENGDEGEMRLVSIRSGDSLFVMEGKGIFLQWSPDSRRIAFFGMDQTLYVYEVPTRILHFYTLPEPYESLERFQWSPDSRHLSWYDRLHSSPTTTVARLWVLPDNASTPHLAFTGAIAPHSRGWSPRSDRLLFEVQTSADSVTIYETDSQGSPATPFLANYYFRGWVEGGNRILTSGEDGYYLTRANGSASTFFAPTDGWVSIAPTGDKVMYRSGASAVLQATDSTTPIVIEGFDYCDAYALTWRTDGEMVMCPLPDAYGTMIGTSTLIAPEHLYTLEFQLLPQFLPLSHNAIALSEYYFDESPGYPVLRFVKSSLFNPVNGAYKVLSYPYDDVVAVLEWRYLP